MRIIGDVHGKLDDYKKVALASPDNASVQVGDMGFDYFKLHELKDEEESYHSHMKNHRFFRGNHDNYDATHDIMLEDYFGVHQKMFYLAGSISIDALSRVQHYMNTGEKTWWYEEEIPTYQVPEAVEAYMEYVNECLINGRKIVVLSHDCPLVAKKYLRSFGRTYDLKKFGYYTSDIDCKTQKLLQAMYDYHNPDLWIFGHWHRNIEVVLGETRFLCLGELEYVDIIFERGEVKSDQPIFR